MVGLTDLAQQLVTSLSHICLGMRDARVLHKRGGARGEGGGGGGGQKSDGCSEGHTSLRCSRMELIAMLRLSLPDVGVSGLARPVMGVGVGVGVGGVCVCGGGGGGGGGAEEHTSPRCMRMD